MSLVCMAVPPTARRSIEHMGLRLNWTARAAEDSAVGARCVAPRDRE